MTHLTPTILDKKNKVQLLLERDDFPSHVKLIHHVYPLFPFT
jgi:hypothetical protein